MSDHKINHAVIVLAAGASRRLGMAKQLVSFDGESLINHTLRLALETQPMQTVLALGHDADAIYSTIRYPLVERVDSVDWERGMSASLKTGIQHVSLGCDGALILLCDQPALSASHLNALLNAWHQQPDHAVASAYADTVGVPALLPRDWFKKILSIKGDQGARELLRNDANVIRVQSPELVHDVDFTQDLPGNSS